MMSLSQKRQAELYSAISDPIMDKRIAINNSSDVLGKRNALNLDEMMFRLEKDIWREVSRQDFKSRRRFYNSARFF